MSEHRKEGILRRIFSGFTLLLIGGTGFFIGGVLIIFLAFGRNFSGDLPASLGFAGYIRILQLTNGFAFIAYGLLFTMIIWSRSAFAKKRLWFALLISFLFIWLPYLILGLYYLVKPGKLTGMEFWSRYYLLIILWSVIMVIGFYTSGRECFPEFWVSQPGDSSSNTNT
jgi:hypothetical protein